MNETLSDRLDVLEQIEKDKKIAEERRIDKLIAKIDKAVDKEFNKAQKILGYRLTMERNHYNMFSFLFKIASSKHLHCYINKRGIQKDCLWRLTIYNHQLGYNSKVYFDFKYLKNKFKTTEISNMLIEFVNTYFKERKND